MLRKLYANRLRQTLQDVKNNPEHWDQSLWHCNTSHCFAGFAEVRLRCEEQGLNLNEHLMEEYSYEDYLNDKINHAYFGITKSSWSSLVNPSNTLTQLEFLIETLIQHNGTLVITDTPKISLENMRFLSLDLSSAELAKVNLKRAYLAGINLTDADLTGADLTGADLQDVNLSRANLTSANLSGAKIAWGGLNSVNLTHANLSGADLTGANLSGANLTGANLKGANLIGCQLWGASFIFADLSDANLLHANLSGVNLFRANLTGADMGGTDVLKYV